MEKKKLVVFTGAGVSADSGIATFRDADGLWANYRIEDVCTPEALARNREQVIGFYNMRRRELLASKPNAGHYALAGLKTIFMQGYQYKKAGVIITEITDSTQLGLFDSVDREKRERLQQTIDKINGKHSRLVKLAIQGTGRNWKLKQKQLSGHYTTDINQIISINCTYPTACQRKQYS